MFQVIADGQAWIDADGNDTFDNTDAQTLAAHLQYSQGYDDVIVIPV